MNAQLVLYAPNIHQGGGRALLLPLLEEMQGSSDVIFILDHRLQLPAHIKLSGEVFQVKASLFSRLLFEWRLKYILSSDACLLSMSNVPPLFAHQGVQHVFVQNKYLVDPTPPLAWFSFKIRFRIWIERLWLRSRAKYVHNFFVQTNSMQALLQQTLNHNSIILPFASESLKTSGKSSEALQKKYDFIYVASGEIHKNHKVLINAWVELAQRGIFPSLALTLNYQRFPRLCKWIEDQVNVHNLRILILGECEHSEILALYHASGALIYPSLYESFGLPLIEAARAGLPVLAGKLDYIRDVIVPSVEFDQTSPKSIADAVESYSTAPAKLKIKLLGATDFLHCAFNVLT